VMKAIITILTLIFVSCSFEGQIKRKTYCKKRIDGKILADTLSSHLHKYYSEGNFNLKFLKLDGSFIFIRITEMDRVYELTLDSNYRVIKSNCLVEIY